MAAEVNEVDMTCLYQLPDTLDEALAADEGAAEVEGTRMALMAKIASVWQDMGDEFIQNLIDNIPPENYKPMAASMLNALLDQCKKANVAGFDPMTHFRRKTSIVFLSGNILRFYYTGDQELTEEQLLEIWQDRPFRIPGDLDNVSNIDVRREHVTKMKKVIRDRLGPPCKKKGGKKSKRKQRKNKRSRKYK
jgi:hypothetical protein